MTQITTKSIRMSYENLEAAVAQFLYTMGILNDDEDVIGIDFAIEVDEEGMVEFDVDYVKETAN